MITRTTRVICIRYAIYACITRTFSSGSLQLSKSLLKSISLFNIIQLTERQKEKKHSAHTQTTLYKHKRMHDTFLHNNKTYVCLILYPSIPNFFNVAMRQIKKAWLICGRNQTRLRCSTFLPTQIGMWHQCWTSCTCLTAGTGP